MSMAYTRLVARTEPAESKQTILATQTREKKEVAGFVLKRVSDLEALPNELFSNWLEFSVSIWMLPWQQPVGKRVEVHARFGLWLRVKESDWMAHYWPRKGNNPSFSLSLSTKWAQ